jgi:hypothetical protein
VTTTAQASSPRSSSGRPTTATSATLAVGEEEVLDLLGRDVLALADDHVLEPAGDRDVAAGVDRAQVAGAEPAVVVEGVGVERRVEVALVTCGPLTRSSPSSPIAACRPSRVTTLTQLRAGDRRALGLGQHVVGASASFIVMIGASVMPQPDTTPAPPKAALMS